MMSTNASARCLGLFESEQLAHGRLICRRKRVSFEFATWNPAKVADVLRNRLAAYQAALIKVEVDYVVLVRMTHEANELPRFDLDAQPKADLTAQCRRIGLALLDRSTRKLPEQWEYS